LERQKIDEAESLLSRTLLVQENVGVLHWLAHVLELQGKLDEAKLEYEKAHKLDPNNPTYRIMSEILDTYMLPADKRIKAVLDLGDFPEVFYNVGNQLRALGEYDEAILCFKRIEQGPCLFDAYVAIAESYIDLEKWDKAAVYAEHASAIDPDSIDMKHVKFNILCGQGKMKEADDLITSMETGTDVNPVVHSFRGFLCELNGDSEGAVNNLTKAIASFPLDADLRARRASAYCRLGKNELALADVEFALDSSSYKELLLRIRSCIYLRTMQFRKFWQSQGDRVKLGMLKAEAKNQVSAARAS
jgi:tetratricopeptide (TPR) repeat protein